MSDDLSPADIPAGRELGDLLARMGKHLDELCGAELVDYVEALQRQVNCLEALRASAVNELAYCPPTVLEQDSLRTSTRSELVPGVIEAALGWTRGRARHYDNVAYLLAELFPATHTALAEGLVDFRPRRRSPKDLVFSTSPTCAPRSRRPSWPGSANCTRAGAG